MKDFEYLKFRPKTTYPRYGKPAYFDPFRKRLIAVTPEESVRQAFIRFLVEELGCPKESLDTEVSISHFKSGNLNRIDILASIPSSDKKSWQPLFLVECKAPGKSLLTALEQCKKYDRIVKSQGHIFITNGTETLFFVKRGSQYELAKSLPSFKQLLKKDGVKHLTTLKPFRYMPPVFSQRTSKTSLQLPVSEQGWIGEGSPKEHLGYLGGAEKVILWLKSRRKNGKI